MLIGFTLTACRDGNLLGAKKKDLPVYAPRASCTRLSIPGISRMDHAARKSLSKMLEKHIRIIRFDSIGFAVIRSYKGILELI